MGLTLDLPATGWGICRRKADGTLDKAPRNPKGTRISTAKPEQWATRAAAEAAMQPGDVLSYRVNGQDDNIVPIDLDKCVKDGKLNAQARELVAVLDSYTELSASGTGLHILCRGNAPAEVANHEHGVEVYTGTTARHIALTGNHLPGTPETVRTVPDSVLADIVARYGKAKGEGTTPPVMLPDLVDVAGLLDGLNLPDYALAALNAGDFGNDRSARLQAVAAALFEAGLNAAQVLSVLVDNVHAMGIAGEHWERDPVGYLWKHHVLDAKKKARKLSADFSDLDVLATEAATSASNAEAKGTTPPAKFRITPAGVVARRPPPEWLIHGVVPRAEVGCIFGPSGSGKSFLAWYMAHCVALGGAFWGHPVTTPGNVVYAALEGAGGMGSRVRAHEQHFGVTYGDKLQVLEGSFSLLDKADVVALVAAVRGLGGDFRMVVIDTTAMATTGADENSGKDMGPVIAACKAIAAALNVLVLLVSHSGKDESKGVRGWSGQRGAMDFQICVSIDKNRNRTAILDKLKDGADAAEWPFRLEVVELGTDRYGQRVSSCVAVLDDARIGQPSARELSKPWATGKNHKAVEAALRELWTYDRHPVDPEVLQAKAVSHRKAVARATDEKIEDKTATDGVRKAIAALVGAGKLFTNQDGKLDAVGLHPTPPANLSAGILEDFFE
jgi:hypothetical protein